MKDDELKSIVDSIIIQSRLKTPASAFKKMVKVSSLLLSYKVFIYSIILHLFLKSAKISAQLFDLLGMRIIIKEKKKLAAFTTKQNEKSSLDTYTSIDPLEGNENVTKENTIVVEYIEQAAADGYDNIEQQSWEENVGTYKDDHRAFENRVVCMFLCLFLSFLIYLSSYLENYYDNLIFIISF
jgi:hypothetical protein